MIYKHKCAYCGKQYETDTYYSKYCSKECSVAAEEIRKNEYAKTKTSICARCGKEFLQVKYKNGNFSHRKYCSDFCRDNLEKSENGAPILTCIICGKKFEGRYSSGRIGTDLKYCSSECEKISIEKFKENYQTNKKRVCKYCGKEFIVPRIKDGHFSETVFCSDECRFLGTSRSQNKAQGKRIKTCINKYGVIYPCLTEQCRKSLQEASVYSKTNDRFGNLLEENNIQYSTEKVIDEYAYDFSINDINTLIEINPSYTHSIILNHFNNNKKDIDFTTYHINKTNKAKENNYNCIHVWQWDDWDKIINIIKPKQKLYARNLQLECLDKIKANVFIDKYHIQNRCRGNIVNLGLYNEGELVQVMTFGKPRYNKNYEWELLRLCSHSDYMIIGGAERLFKYFINNYNPQSIISYCDISKFTGDVYERLGFKLKKQTKPQKIWSKGNMRITDNLLRQRGYDQLFNTNYGKGTSNEQLMLDNGWLPVYDCGQKVFEYF